MSKYIKLKTGEKFGRLTIIKLHHITKYKGNNFEYYLCKCDCGNEHIALKHSIKSSNSKSCGCYNDEIRKVASRTHGLCNTKLYKTWLSMKNRCNNKRYRAYKDYGGRGITICKEWLVDDGFMNFYDWSITNGYKKELSIDRINNDGNYKPSNCRWATRKIQNRNTRRSKMITYKGKTRCIPDWAEILCMNPATLRSRLEKWSIKKSLTTPVRK